MLRKRQVDVCEFRENLIYKASTRCQPVYIVRSCLKEKKEKKKESETRSFYVVWLAFIILLPQPLKYLRLQMRTAISGFSNIVYFSLNLYMERQVLDSKPQTLRHL